MVCITTDDLPGLRNKLKDRRIVYCSGVFDLTHVGHILFFEESKKLGDILVVSVGGDAIVKHQKGNNRPVLNEKMRLKTVDSLKPVDYCFIDNISNKDNQLLSLDIVFEKLKPDIYAINKDAFNIPYREQCTKKNSVKLAILERWCPPEFENISTSKIIQKIKSED